MNIKCRNKKASGICLFLPKLLLTETMVPTCVRRRTLHFLLIVSLNKLCHDVVPFKLVLCMMSVCAQLSKCDEFYFLFPRDSLANQSGAVIIFLHNHV